MIRFERERALEIDFAFRQVQACAWTAGRAVPKRLHPFFDEPIGFRKNRRNGRRHSGFAGDRRGRRPEQPRDIGSRGRPVFRIFCEKPHHEICDAGGDTRNDGGKLAGRRRDVLRHHGGGTAGERRRA